MRSDCSNVFSHKIFGLGWGKEQCFMNCALFLVFFVGKSSCKSHWKERTSAIRYLRSFSMSTLWNCRPSSWSTAVVGLTPKISKIWNYFQIYANLSEPAIQEHRNVCCFHEDLEHSSEESFRSSLEKAFGIAISNRLEKFADELVSALSQASRSKEYVKMLMSELSDIAGPSVALITGLFVPSIPIPSWIFTMLKLRSGVISIFNSFVGVCMMSQFYWVACVGDCFLCSYCDAGGQDVILCRFIYRRASMVRMRRGSVYAFFFVYFWRPDCFYYNAVSLRHHFSPCLLDTRYFCRRRPAGAIVVSLVWEIPFMF